MKIRIATIFLVLFCSGCLPYPHFEVKVSDVKGKVTRDGIPLSGATVKISENADWACNEALFATSTTNSEGEFDLKGKRKFRFVRPLIGDPFYINQICIINGNETFLGYLGGGVGWPPETLHFKCDITSRSVTVTEKTPLSEIHRYAVCTPEIASVFRKHLDLSVPILTAKVASTPPGAEDPAFCALQLLFEINTQSSWKVIRAAETSPHEVASRLARGMVKDNQDALWGFRNQERPHNE